MESKYIFGIDLGTTYSVISYLDENLLIQTCSNDAGDMITPSVVDLSNENPLVGKEAKDNKVFYPHNVLDFFKRQMGQGHSEIYYGEDLDKTTTPIDLSAEVLRYLAKYASDATDSTVEVVVITVPAYFGTEEKQATKEAAERAGFKKVYLIEEPTAAAVYYGYKGDKNETVLVYDLGGGTFDVVAVEINGYNYNCFAVDGDYQLGGKDWDSCMVEIIHQHLSEEGVEECDLDEEDIAAIQVAAENAKKALTPKPETTIKLRLSTGRYQFEITRQEFEDKTKDLLDRTIERTRGIKEQGEAKGHKFTRILLVGGSSYMPQVQRRLMEEFSDIEIPNPMDPNKAVSKGAAYYAKCIIGKAQAKKESDNDTNSSKTQSPSGTSDEPIFELPSAYDPNFVIPDGEIPTIQSVATSSIGIKGKVGDEFKIFTMLTKGSVLPVTKDMDFSLASEAIAAGSVDLNLFEHRLEEKMVALDDPDAELKELQKQVGEISKGLAPGSKMHIHMEINEEGLLVLTASDPNGVEIKLEATAEAKSAG